MKTAAADKERSIQEQRSTEIVNLALELSRLMPKQPAECGKRIKSGVVEDDRLDVALEKTDAALYKANNRGARCATFYDNVKQGRSALTGG